MELRVPNSNNHQTMYGVLAAALQASQEYMTRAAGYAGEASFTIVVGVNEVGQGTMGVLTGQNRA